MMERASLVVLLRAERARSECVRPGQERVSARSGWAGENVARNRGSTRLPLKINWRTGADDGGW